MRCETKHRRLRLAAAACIALLAACPIVSFGEGSQVFAEGGGKSGGGKSQVTQRSAPAQSRARGNSQPQRSAARAPEARKASQPARSRPTARNDAPKRQQAPVARTPSVSKRRAEPVGRAQLPIGTVNRDPAPRTRAAQQPKSQLPIQREIERRSAKSAPQHKPDRPNPKSDQVRRSDGKKQTTPVQPKVQRSDARDPKASDRDRQRKIDNQNRTGLPIADPIKPSLAPREPAAKERDRKSNDGGNLSNRDRTSRTGQRSLDPSVRSFDRDGKSDSTRRSADLRSNLSGRSKSSAKFDSFSGDRHGRQSSSHQSSHSKHSKKVVHKKFVSKHASSCGHSACHGRSHCGFSSRFHDRVHSYRSCGPYPYNHFGLFYGSGGRFSLSFSFSNYHTPCYDPWTWRTRYWRSYDYGCAPYYHRYTRIAYYDCDDWDWCDRYCYRPVYGCYRPRYNCYRTVYYPVYLRSYSYYDEPDYTNDYPWISDGYGGGIATDGYTATEPGISYSSQDGWELLGSGDAREARRVFDRAINVYPADGLPLIGYSIAAARLDRHEEAVEYMRRALRTDPEALNEVPQDEQVQQQISQALSVFENRAQSSDDPDSLFMVAALRYLAGEEALAYFAIDRVTDRGYNDASDVNLKAVIQATIDEFSPVPQPLEGPQANEPAATEPSDISF
jgi:tetratricopeptide (TPR) repeat protein